LLPEFEAQLAGEGRLSVEDFATRLSDFFLDQWNARKGGTGDAMEFIVAGYDEDAPYGRLFVSAIPIAPKPVEKLVDDFGIQWGGQSEITSRILNGCDNNTFELIFNKFAVPAGERSALAGEVHNASGAKIPYQFLPLQDCVDLSVLLIRSTAQILDYQVGIRGVGGNIDVATITRREGFQYVQRKEIRGERLQKNLIV
jgi:hypothetical protein